MIYNLQIISAIISYKTELVWKILEILRDSYLKLRSYVTIGFVRQEKFQNESFSLLFFWLWVLLLNIMGISSCWNLRKHAKKKKECVFSSVKSGNFSNPLPYEIEGNSASSVVCFFFLSFKITCHLSKINTKGKYISGYVITQLSGAACL